MAKQTPCLWFDTEADEAARFSTSVWPDAEVLGTLRRAAEDSEREGQVLTAQFRLGDTE